MKRPDFQEKTEVKVVCKKMANFYGKRGKVAKILVSINGKEYDSSIDKEAIKAAYANGEEDKMHWYVLVKFPESQAEPNWIPNSTTEYRFEPEDLQPVQKKFIDIDYIREDDLVIGKKEDGTDAIRPKNTGAFEPGDIIQISTKIDGANASIAWDETTSKLEIFSRTNLLDSPGALRGFYDYIKTEVEPKLRKADVNEFKNIVIFGEWCVKHSITSYNKDWFNHWRIYDIWDKSISRYWTQNAVKGFCAVHSLEYIEELYYGPFIGWDHCRSFLNKSTAYGPDQEGIVIKNQTKLGNSDNRNPVYIKIVNDKFKESQHSKKPPKEIDPEKEAEKQKAAELAGSIVTEARVRKLILKLIDEGKVPIELKPTNMGAVMKLLPRLVFEDCVKEENETIKLLGEYAGKFIAAETAKQARKIVIGE